MIRLSIYVGAFVVVSAVGYAAVQQVSAAQKHYSAQFSTVVSNAPYTVSAQHLVKTNDVFLLHHNELLSFSKK
ncbi:hypothetical protein AA0313_1444 [Acetobacter indonesiensis NRIC 0313]|uniref:Endonuclease n=1 Tax=Acetobacter indonesiensis TaxID=104101 RepID=A0A6N3T661_9PROT|nr:restriction endonuclease [Acetobacter indonesiensis]GAN63004.1 endonuclease [Acetobacter indonesiensis]GBQ57378.1 hypothetical protein AA0313_1444 [Acetobacter indonesiensis NRIC 0313]GEN04692.1 hypothetical protein AIN02nite_27170 [Acetobacter indonesiensis]